MVSPSLSTTIMFITSSAVISSLSRESRNCNFVMMGATPGRAPAMFAKRLKVSRLASPTSSPIHPLSIRAANACGLTKAKYCKSASDALSMSLRPSRTHASSSMAAKCSGVAICVGVGVGVGTAVGIGVATAVGVGVGTAVGIGVATAVGVSVATAVGVGVGTAVGIGVATAVGVSVATAVGIGVATAVAVAAAGVGVWRPSPQADSARVIRTQRTPSPVAPRVAAPSRGRARLLPLFTAPPYHRPPTLDAVRAYATLGEICGAMREVFGKYRPPTVI